MQTYTKEEIQFHNAGAFIDARIVGVPLNTDPSGKKFFSLQDVIVRLEERIGQLEDALAKVSK